MYLKEASLYMYCNREVADQNGHLENFHMYYFLLSFPFRAVLMFLFYCTFVLFLGEISM